MDIRNTRKRKTRTEWEGIIADYRMSGLTVKQYAKEHGITYALLIAWKQKLAKVSPEAPMALCELHGNRKENILKQQELVITIGSHVSIAIRGDLTPATMQELLLLIQGLCV